MKFLIVGAGAQGAPCASILSRDPEVDQIILADINRELAERVKEKIKSDKITIARLDAGNVNDIAKLAKETDAIINLTLTAYDMNIMKAALKCGANYVDTSFGEPDLMDIRARDNILAQIIENRPLSFNKEFKDAGLTALLGCGSTPGLLNVVAKYLCDKFERVNAIRLRMGGKSLIPSKEVVSAWAPSWSPFRALWGYTVGPTIFEDGQYKRYTPFACPEEYIFPEPVGPVLLSYHQHQEPITLPYYIGKGIMHCDFKYPVDTTAGAFVKMGFGSPDAIDVNGVNVIPRDVLLKLVRQPVNAFLNENETTAKAPTTRRGFSVVEVDGEKDGEKVKGKIIYSRDQSADARLKMFRKLGTNRIGVALPAIVGIKMCIEGVVDRGVISSECLDPSKFLKNMSDIGYPIKLTESITRDISFS